MSAAKPFSYDVVPYQSNPFPQTHPEHLATIATLFGLQPAPVERCRVLELGCASGGNLIPMALALPEATFVGVDLSERQINDGLEVVRALGLKNLELKHLSITEVDEGFGKFDYISSHGVYSWVPNAVQDAMLDVCRKSINPNGIAYISYNVYPGWRMRSMIRDMMLFHAGPVADPKERVEQARAMLEFLSQSTAKDNNPYGTFLKQEVELLSKHSDSYLFHEHLED
jgi:SAM-dependent methyltransferase